MVRAHGKDKNTYIFAIKDKFAINTYIFVLRLVIIGFALDFFAGSTALAVLGRNFVVSVLTAKRIGVRL